MNLSMVAKSYSVMAWCWVKRLSRNVTGKITLLNRSLIKKTKPHSFSGRNDRFREERGINVGSNPSNSFFCRKIMFIHSKIMFILLWIFNVNQVKKMGKFFLWVFNFKGSIFHLSEIVSLNCVFFSIYTM